MPLDVEELKLDARDIAVASVLAVEPRLPLRRIASKTRLSREIVSYRIEKMRENGFLQDFQAVIDYSRLGAFYYRFYLKFAGLSETLEGKIFKRLNEMHFVKWFGLCSGYWDCVIELWAENNLDLSKKMSGFYGEFGGNIVRQHVGVQTCFRVYAPAMVLKLPPRPAFSEDAFSRSSAVFDAVDLKLLSSSHNNARKSFQEFGSEAGVEPGVARYRLKQLEQKKVIKGFFTAFDYSKLGFERYKIFFSTQPEGRKDLINYFVQLPNTYVVITMLGAWDLEVELFPKNGLELHKILNEVMRLFPKTIKNYETAIIFKDCNNKQDLTLLLKPS